MRAFVILEHMLVPERSLAHSASEDFIFAILRRLRTDGRTDRIRTFRRLHFQFSEFPFHGATPPDDSIIIVPIIVVTVVIIVIVVVVVVIVIAPRGFYIGSRRYF